MVRPLSAVLALLLLLSAPGVAAQGETTFVPTRVTEPLWIPVKDLGTPAFEGRIGSAAQGLWVQLYQIPVLGTCPDSDAACEYHFVLLVFPDDQTPDACVYDLGIHAGLSVLRQSESPSAGG